MAKAKRVAKSTIAGQIDQFQTVAMALKPKIELSERELTLFDHIVSSREVATWDDNHLWLAGQLAVIYRRIEAINIQLNSEGVVQVNERGTQIANPLFAALTQLYSAAQSLNRSLGLAGNSRGFGDAAQKSRNMADSQARKLIQKAAEDDLLA